MKNRIETMLGSFIVWMSYKPSANDSTLKRLKRCIDEEAKKMIDSGVPMPELTKRINESNLEKKLYNSLCEADGAAPRLSLDLGARIIELSNF